jgi:trimeric autotransporter adhesin
MTAGDIYTIAGNGSVWYCGDGGPATRAQIGTEFAAVRVDQHGNILIADTDNNRIRVVATSTGTFYGQAMTAGDIYTVAGAGNTGSLSNGVPATTALLILSQGMTTDSNGNLLISDPGHDDVRVVAETTGRFYGQAMTAGDIYTIAGDGTQGSPTGSNGDGGPATEAELWYPTGLVVDGNGNVLIADREDNKIRVVAETTGRFYGQAMTAGDIYTVAGDGTAGFAGDGAPAASAELDDPQEIALDKAGNLVIVDTYNNRIRVVATSSGTFYGQAMTAGDIYTVAGDGVAGFAGDGGAATNAEIDYPDDVAVDAAGNLLLADTGNNRIRVIATATGTFYGQKMAAGDIYTIAGNGTEGFGGDGGQATKAEFFLPSGIAVNAQGDVLIADNIRIREISS